MKHLETRGNIELYFEALPEYLPLEDTFDDNVNDIDQLYADIEAGKYIYFCAHIVAMKNGVELGNDYLGACLYESIDQFVENNDYCADMKDEAYKEACQTILTLCKA